MKPFAAVVCFLFVALGLCGVYLGTMRVPRTSLDTTFGPTDVALGLLFVAVGLLGFWDAARH